LSKVAILPNGTVRNSFLAVRSDNPEMPYKLFR